MHRSRLAATPHPLHVLCACDTFKGTLPSDKVGEAVEAGYRQVWQKLSTCPNESAQCRTAEAFKTHTQPSVTLPPPHNADVPDVELPPIAAELLAESLFDHPALSPQHHHHHHHQDHLAHPTAEGEGTHPHHAHGDNTEDAEGRRNGTEAVSMTPEAAAAAAGVKSKTKQDTVEASPPPVQPPVDFSHTPMSDGGAGLIDSVTFATTRAAQHKHEQQQQQQQQQQEQIDPSHILSVAHAGQPTESSVASALTNTAAAGGVAVSTLHAPPNLSEALQLRRVYVPTSTVITGPLGTPIPHRGDDDEDDTEKGEKENEKKHRTASSIPATTTTASCSASSPTPVPHSPPQRISFACDVARRVLVIEMAEAAGLPRITHARDRNPSRTTSFGVGELIRYALTYMEKELRKTSVDAGDASEKTKQGTATNSHSHHAEETRAGHSEKGSKGVRLFLGIGGSSTNDGGLGALQALGLDVYVRPHKNPDAPASASASVSGSTSSPSLPPPGSAEDDVKLETPFCGADLRRVTRVHISETMLRLFPYLRQEESTPSASFSSPAKDASSEPGNANHHHDSNGDTSPLHIAEVCLICDVDNPLVGPRGATYTFGPQKCAPPEHTAPAQPTESSPNADAAPASQEDAAVGAVTSARQQVLLDSLEAGMRHAATRVVAATWQALLSPRELADVRASAAAVAPADTRAGGTTCDAEAAARADLLYRPGGGGAGGMSGFFRYVLKGVYVPGADVVGGLLGLYETPRVGHLLGSDELGKQTNNVTNEWEGEPRSESDVQHSSSQHHHDPLQQDDAAGSAGAGHSSAKSMPPSSAASHEPPLTMRAAAVRHPRGCLFHACDVVISGEGSFDDQTISSHKTVGRLLEMCTAANAYRLWRHYCAHGAGYLDGSDGADPANASSLAQPSADLGCRTIQEFIVVCGRTNFEDYATCQTEVLKAVCKTLLLPSALSTGEAAKSAPPVGGSSSLPATSDEQPHDPEKSNEDTKEVNPDVLRVNMYLRALLDCPAFRAHEDGGEKAISHHHHHLHLSPNTAGRADHDDNGDHHTKGDRSDASGLTWNEEHILRRFCVPRVTVLPLTPTLFTFADATQKPYACVTAAVADLLEDAARRIAEVKERAASSAA